VLGVNNHASGEYSLAAGDDSTASGEVSSVLGGLYNRAADGFGVVAGGCSNLVGTGTVSVSADCTNSSTFPADFAAVTGGSGNQADGIDSSDSGGQFNLASDPFSSITGGCDNLAGQGQSPGDPVTASCASSGGEGISGGEYNDANGTFSTVVGGCSNIAGQGDNSPDSYCPGTGYESILGGYEEQQVQNWYSQAGIDVFNYQ
jgi:hypothetical protein